jgi:predicted MFS family arabinose efflux permease
MQAIAGALIVAGHAQVWMLAVLGLVFGLADGFVIPTSQGLIPLVVSSTRLQQANALLGLSRSILGIVGPAIGGVLVAVGSPGAALLVDAASFGVAALLLLRVAIPPSADTVEPEPFLAELRAGWHEFRRQTWIWTTIVFFGIGNFASMSVFVLGPLIAKRHYSGGSTWALLVSSFAAGTIVGGLIALRIKPRRPLAASCIAAWPIALQPLGLALEPPVAVLVAIAVVAGIGLAIHLALWFTVFQQHVPEAARSRVSSYDALGSFVLVPLGSAVAGPVSALVGIRATLLGTCAIELACFSLIILQPSIWAIRRRTEEVGAGAEAAA